MILALLLDASVETTKVPVEFVTKVTPLPDDMKSLAEEVNPVEYKVCDEVYYVEACKSDCDKDLLKSTYVTGKNFLPCGSAGTSLIASERSVNRGKDCQSFGVGNVQIGQGIQRLGVVQGGCIERQTGRRGAGRGFGQSEEDFLQTCGSGKHLRGARFEHVTGMTVSSVLTALTLIRVNPPNAFA